MHSISILTRLSDEYFKKYIKTGNTIFFDKYMKVEEDINKLITFNPANDHAS